MFLLGTENAVGGGGRGSLAVPYCLVLNASLSEAFLLTECE